MEPFGEDELRKQIADSQMAFESQQLLFCKIIHALPASARLLTRIKLEYESVFKKIAKSQSMMVTRVLQEKIRATEVATLSNYHKRARELEIKLDRIRTDNTRMQNALDGMRLERIKLLENYEARLQSSKLRMTLQNKSSRKASLALPLNEATSVEFLQDYLLSVEAKLLETREVTEKKYISCQKKTQLQQQLKGREDSRTTLSTENRALAKILRKLRVAVKAVESYLPYLSEQQLDPSTCSVETYIKAVLARQPDLEDDISDEDPEDPAKDLEAEMVLDCYEKFNELFESEKYEEAALHAATSPKGVLRTLKTLLLFKSSARHQPGKKLPLLSYCELLLQCASAYRPISLEESIECAKCILAQGRSNELLHWISQGAIPSSPELGTLIFRNCNCSKLCTCGCKSLAFTVFDQSQALTEAAICLLQQGKHMHFLSYATKARFSKQDYIDMLCSAPSEEFAMLLVHPPKPHRPVSSIFELMDLLLERGHAEKAVQYLEAHQVKLNLTLVKAVMSDSKLSEELLRDVVKKLEMAEFLETACDLLSSWTVIQVIQKSILRLQEEEIPLNQFGSGSSTISATNSGLSQSDDSYETESDDEDY